MNYTHVSHESLDPFVPKDCRILVLGSMPSITTRSVGFYYAHKTNRFFKILSLVFTEQEPISIGERKEFLTNHKIGLYDSIYECDIHSSSDSSIKNVVSSKTIIDRIKKEKDIKAIFTTGKASDMVYKKYIGDDNISLPSTSAANATMSLSELVKAYSIIKETLLKYK